MINIRRFLCVILVVSGVALIAGCKCLSPSVAGETGSSHAVVIELVKAKQSWDGATLPSYPEGQPEITILDITVPPGVRLADHFHPVINAGVVLSGQLTVVTEDGKKLHLNTGDPIVEVVNTMHYGMNEGSEPTRLLVFYAGIESAPITTLEE